MDELIVMQADKLFRWEGPKRKQTLFGASLGRLLLTDQRLLFLSTGKNDVNAKRLIAGAMPPIAGQRTSSTSDLPLRWSRIVRRFHHRARSWTTSGYSWSASSVPVRRVEDTLRRERGSWVTRTRT